MALKTTFSWFILTFLLLTLFIADLSLGSVQIPISTVFRILTFQSGIDPVLESIILEFRMTKAITCILAGSGLAVAGLQMQTLFRNPLAGPDVLGLTSGASLAVSLIFMSSTAGVVLFSRDAVWLVASAASLGSAVVFLIMYAVARRLQDNASLLIVGLMVGAGTSSIVSILQYLSKAEELQVYIFWTFGSLGSLSWTEIRVMASILVAGTAISVFTIKPLNAWLLGDDYAQSVGVNVRTSRLSILLSTSILTGGVTAFCGPIAFVGLAVPHLAKLLVRTSNHKVLIPAVFLGGSCLMLFCDVLAQLPRDYVLPINAITAMIGSPVVIWVILRKKFRQL
jgi:iron complex transport system permease protein